VPITRQTFLKLMRGVWQSFHTEYDMLLKHFKGLKVKMMELKVEKRKFDTMEDDDGQFPNNKRGRVD